MSEEKKNSNHFLSTIIANMTGENVQRYILGTKKNGSPRAIYDVVKDYTKPKRKKKKKGSKDEGNTYALYLRAKKHKKKKKKNSWSL